MAAAPQPTQAGDTGAPTPRLAATLVLVRDSPGGPEVLLTKRPEGFRFMGGATVFPGGAVDEADLDPRWERASALARAEASRLLDEPDEALALGVIVCSIREAFEEVGWLEGVPERSIRREDADDAGRFLDRCLELGAVLATDGVVPAGRWVTPLGAPIRFDTFFFVAQVAAGWTPIVDAAEVAAHWWSTPAQALKEQSEGALVMAPPTVEMLQRLAGHDSVAGVIESLNAQSGGASSGATRLSPFVQAVVAPNPGMMTGPGTNTYIVGAEPSFVIDPAVDDDVFLESVVAAAGRVEAILITHRHSDHVGGAARLAAFTGAPVRAFGDAPAGDARVTPVADEDVLETGPVRLVALHTPGHASDHLCFYLEGAASLFSGDNVLGHGTAVIAPPDGDMRAYLQTLHRLRALRLVRIYPGHWPPLDGGAAVIDGYIQHRMDREAAIKHALGDAPASVEAIVARVYVDTPAHLHPIAAYSVGAHLAMLEEMGQVKQVNGQWVLTDVD
jgi:glyoxylase-like metal-dependent hydrolase (beta-lactamase superfamily II)/8-oxo-dGTP pyrophosphatase MutT (NUDIX family)